MTRLSQDDDQDLTAIIAKPLYFAMLVNILLPAALLFVCYYLNERYYPNSSPGLAKVLFISFAVGAFLQAALALWWRDRSFKRPMIRRVESFYDDIERGILRRTRPVFLMISTISLWGFLYFLIAGDFQKTAVFIIFSFVVFQFVRPREGFARKVIAYQRALVEQGKFDRSELLG